MHSLRTLIEAENNELEAARRLMLRARTVAGTDRIWMKSAVFERQHGTLQDALSTADEALAKFPAYDKLYMIKGQILQSLGNTSGARETYALGVKKCPNSVPLWIMSSRLEEKTGLAIKARAILERARFHNKKSDEIWLESVRVEERAGNIAQAKSLMSRGLQECPVSGLLWSESVWMEARPARKTKMLDALKKANNDPLVVLTIARVFWSERKLDKARSWLEKAAAADQDKGDTWAWWLKFENQHGTKQQQENVKEKCRLAEPKHGAIWQAVAKDPKHAGWSTEKILLEVVKKLPEKAAP
jgi:pre-mRNA-processing factor 6